VNHAQERLRNSISDVSPIDLNPCSSGHSLAPQMPLFASPAPGAQAACGSASKPGPREGGKENDNSASSCIPRKCPSLAPHEPAPAAAGGRAPTTAPDSPCSRSLKSSVKASEGGTHIPRPLHPSQQQMNQASPKRRGPPLPRLPFIKPRSQPPSPPSHKIIPSPNAVTFKRDRANRSCPQTPPSAQPSSKRVAQSAEAVSPIAGSPTVLARPAGAMPAMSFGSSGQSSRSSGLAPVSPGSVSPHAPPILQKRKLSVPILRFSKLPPYASPAKPAWVRFRHTGCLRCASSLNQYAF
jgi:hypothetical protein